ncbi:glycosyltransferase family 2 protein [Intrasporangium calvum]|uniref:Glycosyltransferase family 2 protein n=1 Tax=Intrasporangium calvum TaxID=53358 RepID=A0ABT5GHS7_9MICO|nr:glycosyltransferase family A protein [Intrasporangium calvum]MDC5697697.1 glycosyltransferase family 2 protein [Intrasporangium calvum]
MHPSDRGGSDPGPLAVSVIICVRNGAATLAAQLDGLARQVGAPPFEVLLVDNGSTDGSVPVFQRWAAARPGTVAAARVVDASDRVGLCYARNRGAAAAHAPVLAYCDADDIVGSQWVAAAHAAIGSGAEAVGGRVLSLDAARRPTEQLLLDSLDSVGPADGADGVYRYFWGCNFAVSAASLAEVGGFDEALPPYGCDDVEIGIRMTTRGVRMTHEPRMEVYYDPPRGLRRRLTRRYRAGVAEACLWARHPQVYRRRPTVAALLAGLPWTATRAAVRTAGGPKQRVLSAAEALARSVGLAEGLRVWVNAGRVPAHESTTGPVIPRSS